MILSPTQHPISYVRFVVADHGKARKAERAVFAELYRLEREGRLAPVECARFKAAESWLNDNLVSDNRLPWSSRPNDSKDGISWIKTSARGHVARLREVIALLDDKGVFVVERTTQRPGRVIYEDDHQVIAVPFEKAAD